MTAFATAAPTLGHNQPPATIADELAEVHKPDLDLKTELLEAFKSAPDRIDDDITQTKAAELIKKTRALERKLEDARDRAKLPFEDTVKAIRGFFNTTIEPLEKARKALNEKSQAYLQRKADEEKRRLAEEEEKRRAAAAEAMRLAQEAEKAKTASTAAAQEAARLAEEAAQAKAAASSEQEAAAADLAAWKAAHAQIKANMLAYAAEIAIRAKNGDPIDEDEKAAKRLEFDDLVVRARAKIDAAEAVLKAARDKAIAAKQEAERLAREQAEAERQARAAERDAQANLKEAVREEKAADKIAARIDGPDAELARTRSLHGAVSTLERRWTWAVIDRDLLDKEALWPFIHGDAIEVALGKWALSQPQEKRQMTGARIEQETVGQVR
jgi:chemosensory pili system protein ChpA (sensor histidine kinase/response regulator)